MTNPLVFVAIIIIVLGVGLTIVGLVKNSIAYVGGGTLSALFVLLLLVLERLAK